MCHDHIQLLHAHACMVSHTQWLAMIITGSTSNRKLPDKLVDIVTIQMHSIWLGIL
jgi:hypothetical protein